MQWHTYRSDTSRSISSSNYLPNRLPHKHFLLAFAIYLNALVRSLLMALDSLHSKPSLNQAWTVWLNVTNSRNPSIIASPLFPVKSVGESDLSAIVRPAGCARSGPNPSRHSTSRGQTQNRRCLQPAPKQAVSPRSSPPRRRRWGGGGGGVRAVRRLAKRQQEGGAVCTAALKVTLTGSALSAAAVPGWCCPCRPLPPWTASSDPGLVKVTPSSNRARASGDFAAG